MEAIKIHGVRGTLQTMGPGPWTSLESPGLALSQERSNWERRSFPHNNPQTITSFWMGGSGGPSKMGCSSPGWVFNWFCAPSPLAPVLRVGVQCTCYSHNHRQLYMDVTRSHACLSQARKNLRAKVINTSLLRSGLKHFFLWQAFADSRQTDALTLSTEERRLF